METIPRRQTIDKLTYSTSELKLAALIVAGIPSSTFEILEGGIEKSRIPEYWDGRTAERVIEIIVQGLAI